VISAKSGLIEDVREEDEKEKRGIATVPSAPIFCASNSNRNVTMVCSVQIGAGGQTMTMVTAPEMAARYV
jgi:hypothetical protein